MLKSNQDEYSAMEAGHPFGGSHSLDEAMCDKIVRQGFVRKVFGILSVQLIATTLTCALFMLSTGLQTFLIANPWALLVSFGVSFGTLIAMMCNPTLARSYPHNYTLLALFTLAEAVSVGFVCMVSEPRAVLTAAAITTFITLGLTAYAMQTKYDFTTSGGVLTGVLMAFVIVTFIGIFIPHVKAIELVISGAGSVIFSCFLVIDIQMLMDGKRVQLSPDDYIFAALNLYLDIINLFLYVLRALNESRS